MYETDQDAGTPHGFDNDLSLKLDTIILDLEASRSPLWRRWYHLRKRIAERHVPAWYPEVR